MYMLGFNQATTSPTAIFTPVADAIIDQVICIVDTGATGGSPTISVGTTGDTDLYFKTTDSNLLVQQTYIFEPFESCGSTPSAVGLYITPDSQTFAARVFVRYIVLSIGQGN